MISITGQILVSGVILLVGTIVLLRRGSSDKAIDAVSGLLSLVAGFWLR